MWHIYAMEYYSAISKNEIKSSTGKQIRLEIIMLSKINQTEKDKYHFPSHTESNTSKQITGM
jgi:hypothetical protein